MRIMRRQIVANDVVERLTVHEHPRAAVAHEHHHA